MSAITTHVLDTSKGKPAGGIQIQLEYEKNGWQPIGTAITNADGRASDLMDNSLPLKTGRYRLSFETGAYFKSAKIESFYPGVSIVFEVRDATQHYHVPLLLNPFGYSTYRGS